MNISAGDQRFRQMFSKNVKWKTIEKFNNCFLAKTSFVKSFLGVFRVEAGKSYTGEGWDSFEKLEKPVWRPKGRQHNKFRSMLFTIMKTNCCTLLSCLPSGLQNCFQAIWSFPLYKISLVEGFKACVPRVEHIFGMAVMPFPYGTLK